MKTYIQKELQRRQQYNWHLNARTNQLPPQGNWHTWLILAGRGFGKTRTGAETIRYWAEQGISRRIALIGKSIYEARSVMVEGTSGLLSCHPPQTRPRLTQSGRRLEWANGCIATLYGAEQYEQLRGPQFDAVWIDELAKFRHQQKLWEQIMLCLRLGQHPRSIITTTPKPSQFLQSLIKDPNVVVTKGTTFDNQANLAPNFLATIVQQFSQTQLGAQELYAELLTEQEGALWRRHMIHYQEPEILADGTFALERIVVAIDPATTHHENSDETGIVVVGLDAQKNAYVLEDLSGRLSPGDWGERAVNAYWRYKADRIIAEVNKGGDLVERVIRSRDATVSFRAVRATRGKITRAEPIAALYEQKRVFHLRPFSQLETQMCEYTPHTTRYSPDRLDALVWGLTELLLESENRPQLKIWQG